ncbi:MAG: hypothetical protein AB8I08_17845 [Sandaracinaceae bacterium]
MPLIRCPRCRHHVFQGTRCWACPSLRVLATASRAAALSAALAACSADPEPTEPPPAAELAEVPSVPAPLPMEPAQVEEPAPADPDPVAAEAVEVEPEAPDAAEPPEAEVRRQRRARRLESQRLLEVLRSPGVAGDVTSPIDQEAVMGTLYGVPPEDLGTGR